jgi:hypothetical protein
MDRITIYFPYYNQPETLKHQLDTMSSYSAPIRNRVALFIVDDGSQAKPALPVVEQKHLDKLDITLYRINIDIPWNMPEANNLAFREIKTDYVIRNDIDHFFDESNLTNLLGKKRNIGKHYYRFSRITAHDGEVIGSPKNIYMVSRANYLKTKGYNESLSGNYGDDLDFIPRLNGVVKPICLNDVCITVIPNRHARGLSRDTTINRAKAQRSNLPHKTFENEKHYILQIQNNIK